MAATPRRTRRAFRVRSLACMVIAALGGGAAIHGLIGDSASAYVGESMMDIAGITGSWPVAPYRNWIRIEAHYWESASLAAGGRGGGAGARGGPRGFFSPTAPRPGTAGRLIVSIDKHNPALAALMAKCAARTKLADLKFAEDAQLARPLGQIGPRPAAIPDHYEYRLRDVAFSDCPVVADAPEQAVVLEYRDIEWLNYQGTGEQYKLAANVLAPIKASGATKSFVVSWFAIANDVSEDQCPRLNAKPTEDDYYALVPREEADRERADLAARKTAVDYEGGQMSRRGPHRLNVGMLPGIVRDPGYYLPRPTFARGLNLDGNDGSGPPAPGTCRHRNYRSLDGRQTGIDNQLYTVWGCAPGYQGHKGFLMQYRNEQRRNGKVSWLVQISGIDNDRNDSSITVTILHSKDPVAKNADGTRILADYTFRLTNDPTYNAYVTRLPGRIVNGVIMTDQVPFIDMYESTEMHLEKAAMRFEIMPDGSLKGIVAGYQDWRKQMALNTNSNAEQLYGFQSPGMYNAFKREADGLKDPVTGVCNGISVAYDIEGSPAFIPPAQARTLVAEAGDRERRAR